MRYSNRLNWQSFSQFAVKSLNRSSTGLRVGQSAYQRPINDCSLALAAVVYSFLSIACYPAAAAGLGKLGTIAPSGPPLTRPVGVFGKDTRTKLPAKYKELRNSIGMLTARKRNASSMCTAFCVDGDIIATAAHCILYPGSARGRWPLTRFVFKVGTGRRAKSSRLLGNNERAAQWSVIGGETRTQKSNLSRSDDWALAKLAKPICRHATLKVDELPKWSELLEAVTKDRVFIAGYHSYNRGMRFRYSDNCSTGESSKIIQQRWLAYERVASSYKNSVQHKCDMTQGASGSPLLLDTRDGPVVIGINVAELPYARALPLFRKKLPKNKRKHARKAAKLFAANSAVTATAFYEQIDLLRSPSKPLTREQIRLVQGVLRANGNYKGPVDGLYGAGTRQAILDLEREQKRSMTGRPTLRLVALHHFNQGYAAIQEKNFNAAIEQFTRAIELDPDYELSYYNRGNAYRKLKDYDRAIADYDAAERLNPRRPNTYNNRGISYFFKKNYDRAYKNYDEAVKLNPRQAIYYNNRGNLHQRQKRYDKALADLNKAIELRPKYAKAFYNRGLTYRSMGQPERAIQDLDQALTLDPKYVRALNVRGNIYIRKRSYKRAIEDFDRVIGINAESAVAYNNRAWAYFKLGKASVALPDVNKALELAPNYAPAYDTRGHIYEALGQREKAVGEFRKSLSLDPSIKESKEALLRLGIKP